MKNKLTVRVAILLVVAEVMLVLISWLLSATMTEGVHSLLSGEGMRWFLGHYATLVQSPLLIWLLLLSMSAGTFVRSRLLHYCSNYRERLALRLSLIFLALYVAAVLVLTFLPHAILLSPTGTLFPSPFSRAFVPMLAFAVFLFSAIYGLTARTITSLTDLCEAMTQGISQWSPLFLLYLLFMQLYESWLYVFC